MACSASAKFKSGWKSSDASISLNSGESNNSIRNPSNAANRSIWCFVSIYAFCTVKALVAVGRLAGFSEGVPRSSFAAHKFNITQSHSFRYAIDMSPAYQKYGD